MGEINGVQGTVRPKAQKAVLISSGNKRNLFGGFVGCTGKGAKQKEAKIFLKSTCSTQKPTSQQIVALASKPQTAPGLWSSSECPNAITSCEPKKKYPICDISPATIKSDGKDNVITITKKFPELVNDKTRIGFELAITGGNSKARIGDLLQTSEVKITKEGEISFKAKQSRNGFLRFNKNSDLVKGKTEYLHLWSQDEDGNYGYTCYLKIGIEKPVKRSGGSGNNSSGSGRARKNRRRRVRPSRISVPSKAPAPSEKPKDNPFGV